MIDHWRDISTAPKDGTAVLLFGLWAGEINGPEPTAQVMIGSWQGGSTDYADFTWNVEGGDAYAAWANPTHWYPLPRPPIMPSGA